MVIVRDLVLGASRFGDFLASPERIPSNILANRLRAMEERGLVAKEAYQSNPPRYAYRLTEMGKGLVPVMRALKDWGMTWLPNRSPKPPAPRKQGTRR